MGTAHLGALIPKVDGLLDVSCNTCTRLQSISCEKETAGCSINSTYALTTNSSRMTNIAESILFSHSHWDILDTPASPSPQKQLLRTLLSLSVLVLPDNNTTRVSHLTIQDR